MLGAHGAATATLGHSFLPLPQHAPVLLPLARSHFLAIQRLTPSANPTPLRHQNRPEQQADSGNFSDSYVGFLGPAEKLATWARRARDQRLLLGLSLSELSAVDCPSEAPAAPSLPVGTPVSRLLLGNCRRGPSSLHSSGPQLRTGSLAPFSPANNHLKNLGVISL